MDMTITSYPYVVQREAGLALLSSQHILVTRQGTCNSLAEQAGEMIPQITIDISGSSGMEYIHIAMHKVKVS